MAHQSVPAARAPKRLRGPLIAAGVLVAVAIIVPLIVPIYAREDPVLWGFPFFYWYQLLWVFICAALVSIAHRILLSDERRQRRERTDKPTIGPSDGPVR
jgi:hypothetical protein